MSHQFHQHYTRDEARALLPRIRQWFQRLAELRAEFGQAEQTLSKLTESGLDSGGEAVNRWVKLMPEIRDLVLEFQRREIQVKDLDRGLIDFPAIIAGKEVFLCWELAEEDIGFWHDLDAGYAGRQQL